MSETEDDIKQIENLISILETKIQNASPHDAEKLKGTVSDLRTKREEIKQKIKEREDGEQALQRYKLEVAQAMQRETALSSEEKGIFGNFLQKEFFTKADFNSLDQFYTKTWDRLSEQGKDEMSHRIWEGIRHNEFKFKELPESVKEKEASRIYADITKGDNGVSNINQVPQEDKSDFVNAYNSGNKKSAYEILERDCFKNSIAVRKPATTEHTAVEKTKESENLAVQSDASLDTSIKRTAELSSAVTKKSLAGLNLTAAGIEKVTPVSSSENKTPPPPVPQVEGVKENAR